MSVVIRVLIPQQTKYVPIGEVFIKTKPIVNEKREFIRKICRLIEKDNYGLDTSFEKSLVAICKTKQDLELIKEMVKPLELEHPKRQGHYEGFYDELDKKIHKLK